MSDSDEFGDFSDASFEQERLAFPPRTFVDDEELEGRLNELVGSLFCAGEAGAAGLEVRTVRDSEPAVELSRKLAAQPCLVPDNWNGSVLKRNLLAILGITEEIDYSFRAVGREEAAEEAAEQPLEDARELTEDETRLVEAWDADGMLQEMRKSVKNDVYFSTLSSSQVAELSRQYEESIGKLQVLLAYYRAQQKLLVQDNQTFEQVVENLIGYTQKLRIQNTIKTKPKPKAKLNLKSLMKLNSAR